MLILIQNQQPSIYKEPRISSEKFFYPKVTLHQSATIIWNIKYGTRSRYYFSKIISTVFNLYQLFSAVYFRRSKSTPLAATLKWLIKDGTGMVGRILFAVAMGDANVKHFLFND